MTTSLRDCRKKGGRVNTFDVVVIGSGPGGYRAAVLAALRGQKVAIIEKAVWGGCCLNRGCVPKKDWYYSARLLHASRHFQGRGVQGAISGDLGQAWRHQHEIVNTVRASYQDYLHRLGVVAFTGEARLVSPHTVAISGHTQPLEAKSIIVATGSTPILPAGVVMVPGRIVHSDALFDEPVPAGRDVIIIGGGVVATEFAYILRMFGKEVQWYARRSPLAASDFSPAALGLLKKGLDDIGVSPRVAPLRSLTVTESGVHFMGEDGVSHRADWALVATGRRPVTEGLTLDHVGVQCDRAGFVVVNEQMETVVPGIYAIGDCVRGVMTANRALHEASVAVDNIVRPKHRRRDLFSVPEAIYSAVELARVGRNETQAEDADLEPAVGFAAFETSPCALGQDEPNGFVRIIADLDAGTLLGGEVVGSEAGELIHLLACADKHSGLRVFSQSAFNHPSRAEEFQNAVETLAAKWKLQDAVFGAYDGSA